MSAIGQNHGRTCASDESAPDLENKYTVGVVIAVESQGAGEAGRGIVVVDGRDEGSTTEVLAGQIVSWRKGKSRGHVIGSCCIVLSNQGNCIAIVDNAIDDSWWKSGD